MKISDDVMNDLLTIYLAGEASPDTRALIESRARQDAAFAARLEAAGRVPVADLLPAGPAADRELRALTATRQFIRLRTLFSAGAILFTLLPLLFAFDSQGVRFLVLGVYPGLAWSFWSVAAAAWVACYVMHRRIAATGM